MTFASVALAVKIQHSNNKGQRKLIADDVFERYVDGISKAYTSIKVVVKDDVNYYYTGIDDAIELRMNKTAIKLYCQTWKKIEIEGTTEGVYDMDLQSLINKHQEFNVYFTDNELIYGNKTLFRDTRLMSSIHQLLKVLKVLPSLSQTICEKYVGISPLGLQTWDARSIFGAVEQKFMDQYTYFICDDCNDEWADHIGISPQKVSFFVSKHKNSKNSASDFQDVVAQALKNLGNLTPTKGQLDGKLERWRGSYQNSQMMRLRSNNGTVRDAVTMWHDNMMNPNYVREMCLVVDFMSKETFTQQLEDIANNRPVDYKSELLQRLWILSSFVNGCVECGVKPVIYCKS